MSKETEHAELLVAELLIKSRIIKCLCQLYTEQFFRLSGIFTEGIKFFFSFLKKHQ